MLVVNNIHWNLIREFQTLSMPTPTDLKLFSAFMSCDLDVLQLETTCLCPCLLLLLVISIRVYPLKLRRYKMPVLTEWRPPLCEWICVTPLECEECRAASERTHRKVSRRAVSQTLAAQERKTLVRNLWSLNLLGGVWAREGKSSSQRPGRPQGFV